MTRNEHKMYHDIGRIADALEKIAKAHEDLVDENVAEIPGMEGTKKMLRDLTLFPKEDFPQKEKP